MYVAIVSCPAAAAQPVVRSLTEKRLAQLIVAIEGVRSVVRDDSIGGDPRTLLLLLTENSKIERIAAEVAELAAEPEPPPVVAIPEAGGLAAFLDRAEASLAAGDEQREGD